MKKKEFAVGETFQFGLKKLKVVEQPESVNCSQCPLLDICEPDLFQDFLLPLVGYCDRDNRSDGKSVIFVEVFDDGAGEC